MQADDIEAASSAALEVRRKQRLRPDGPGEKMLVLIAVVVDIAEFRDRRKIALRQRGTRGFLGLKANRPRAGYPGSFRAAESACGHQQRKERNEQSGRHDPVQALRTLAFSIARR
jgi:hypothetical protein